MTQSFAWTTSAGANQTSRSGSYSESITLLDTITTRPLNGEDNIIQTPSAEAPSFQLLPLFIPRAFTRVTVNCFEQASCANAVENGKWNGGTALDVSRDRQEKWKGSHFPTAPPAKRTTRLRSHSISLSRHSVMIHIVVYEIHTLCYFNL